MEAGWDRLGRDIDALIFQSKSQGGKFGRAISTRKGGARCAAPSRAPTHLRAWDTSTAASSGAPWREAQGRSTHFSSSRASGTHERGGDTNARPPHAVITQDCPAIEQRQDYACDAAKKKAAALDREISSEDHRLKRGEQETMMETWTENLGGCFGQEIKIPRLPGERLWND